MKLAFVGLKGSGKSTFAHMFTDNVYSFATPLKEASKVLFDLEDVQSREAKKMVISQPELFDSESVWDAALLFFGIEEVDLRNNEYLEVYGDYAWNLFQKFRNESLEHFRGKTMTVREILQKMGTEAGRETFGEDLWVQNMLCRMSDSDDIAIDDCRFLNEAAALKSEGFTVIGIDRPGLEVDQHPSEMEMMEHWDIMVDLTVTNDGTIQETFHNIQQSLEK